MEKLIKGLRKLTIIWYMVAMIPLAYMFEAGTQNFRLLLYIQITALFLVVMQFISRFYHDLN